MKRTAASLVCLSLLASGAALAGPPQERDHRDRPTASDARHHDRHPSNDAPHPPSHSVQHGPRKGERLPQNQRGARVSDYGRHGLRKPGKGNEWRKVDDRYVLMTIATGIVVDIISGSR
jgi:Ni/Co efflux regulator RcnB